MRKGQSGFTLIELLVVIAILGVIAAVVVLNVGNFFGRGTLQAAKTELRQVQTAITAAMADGESGQLGGVSWPVLWSGEEAVVWVDGDDGTEDTFDEGIDYDAADYIYGLLKATYHIQENGEIVYATCNGTDQWGDLTFCNDTWVTGNCS